MVPKCDAVSIALSLSLSVCLSASFILFLSCSLFLSLFPFLLSLLSLWLQQMSSRFRKAWTPGPPNQAAAPGTFSTGCCYSGVRLQCSSRGRPGTLFEDWTVVAVCAVECSCAPVWKVLMNLMITYGWHDSTAPSQNKDLLVP